MLINKFSVLMAVYLKDDPIFFREALNSLLGQTLKATEVILIENGPLTNSHYEIIEEFRLPLNIISHREPINKGLAYALNKGVLLCKYDYIARMDADDLCALDRFYVQMKTFDSRPELDLVGGEIEEFIDHEYSIVGRRYVKENQNEILRSAKYYSPVNHVTVMYKKESVVKAGNYQNFRGVEDYPLWIAMLMNGAQFYNIPKTLVKVRVCGLADRRSGLVYAKVEFSVMYYFYRIGFYNLAEFLFIASGRFFLRTIGSIGLSWIYNLTTRKALK
jgi:glycosyltransferase involved in cell wall biosynthesis